MEDDTRTGKSRTAIKPLKKERAFWRSSSAVIGTLFRHIGSAWGGGIAHDDVFETLMQVSDQTAEVNDRL